VLHLAAPTDPAWVHAALADLPSLLLDHAHCEKKAASTAMNLIFRYVEDEGLMQPLSALAREELAHFELMLGVLRERGLSFTRLEPSAYAPGLLAAARKDEPHRLLDTLLCCALIEARSCERMKLLSEALGPAGEPRLAALYTSLLASEARHFHGYVELATARYGRAAVVERLEVLAAHEAALLVHPEARPVRMHS
jgi:tRNA-(ms[2]io[6]A)-hydroxylase